MASKQSGEFDPKAYWNERYESVDITRSGHIDLPADYNRWLYRRKQEHLDSALVRIGASLQQSRMLEIAAGSGAWIDFWKQHGIASYLGIDLSQAAVSALQTRHPELAFKVHDLSVPGLATTTGGEFDLVTAIDMLYHILEDEKLENAIREIGGVLRVGGRLVIHDVFPLEDTETGASYIKWRTLAFFERALASAGFVIEYRKPTFLFMVQNLCYRGFNATLLQFVWREITEPAIRRSPSFAGATTRFLDTLICRFMRNGPSMQLIVCRKVRA